MKLIINITLLILLSSCFQQSNTSTGDSNLGKEIDENSSAQFVEVYSIIKSKCFNCHNHSFEAADADEESWVNATSQGGDLVSIGSSSNSNLVKRMKTCSSGSNADMPTSGEALTLSECDIVKEWIDSMQQE